MTSITNAIQRFRSRIRFNLLQVNFELAKRPAQSSPGTVHLVSSTANAVGTALMWPDGGLTVVSSWEGHVPTAIVHHFSNFSILFSSKKFQGFFFEFSEILISKYP
jgi:hypothetical protein